MAHTEYKHVLDVVELDTTALAGLVRSTIRAGVTVDRESSSGDPYARHQPITERKPVASWESRHLKSWLQNVGLAAQEIDALATGLKLYAKKAKHGGTRYGGSNHIKYTVRSGIILPRRLAVEHRGSGTISYDAAVTYDGVNAPVAIATGVALPGGLADGERYSLGPVTFDSDTYSGIRRLEIDFGLEEEAAGADSDVDDTEVSISEVKPELTLRGINPNWFGASYVPLDGLALGHTTATIYLRQRKSGATYWPDNQAKHIKATVAGVAVLEDLFDASEQAAGETSLRIPLEYDGTNSPIVWTFDTTMT